MGTKVFSGLETGNVAIAVRRESPAAGGFPVVSEWDAAVPSRFSSDWQGLNADPERQTEVRLLWSQEFLFIRFRCRYREIYVYPGGNVRREQLWLRDVAEVFIQPQPQEIRRYREFEISPNGDWIDLDIAPGRADPLGCDLKSRVTLHPLEQVWDGELALPMKCLCESFDTAQNWKVNFFRVEGPEPRRFYSAWCPTGTPMPNFHVPEAFGLLRFSR
jgi:alpha-galactosidase